MATAPASRRDGKTFDAEVELRAAATVAATTADTGIEYAVRKDGAYKAVIYVTSLDTITNETYIVNIGVSDLVGGTYTPVGQLLDITATGIYEIALSGADVEQLDADAEFVQVKITITGSAPGIVYGAYLSPAY